MRIFFTEEGYSRIKELEEGATYLINVPCTLEFSIKVRMGFGQLDQKDLFRFNGSIKDPNLLPFRQLDKQDDKLHPGLIFSESFIKPFPKKIIEGIIKDILDGHKRLSLISSKEKVKVYKEFDISRHKNFLLERFKIFLAKDLTDTHNKFLFERIIKNNGDVSIE